MKREIYEPRQPSLPGLRYFGVHIFGFRFAVQRTRQPRNAQFFFVGLPLVVDDQPSIVSEPAGFPLPSATPDLEARTRS